MVCTVVPNIQGWSEAVNWNAHNLQRLKNVMLWRWHCTGKPQIFMSLKAFCISRPEKMVPSTVNWCGRSFRAVLKFWAKPMLTVNFYSCSDITTIWASDSKNHPSGEIFQKSPFRHFSFHGIWTTWKCKKNAFRSTPYGLFCRIYLGDVSRKVVKIGEKVF